MTEHTSEHTPENPHVVRRGSGVPLIAVHGNSVDHRLLLPLDDALAEAGEVERIYVDLPGFGRTSALQDDGGLPELAAWLVDWIRAEVGERPFAVLGNSLGGLLARHVAAEFGAQVLGLGLLAPVVDPDEDRRTRTDLVVRERDDAFMSTLDPDDAAPFLEMSPRLTRDTWERFREHALPGVRAVDEEALKRLSARYVLDAVPEEAAPPFEGPALILTGREDHLVGYRDQAALLEHYPRATYAALDAAGHNVHLDQPEVAEALVRAWAVQVGRAAVS